jgi:hypothetical protein
MKMTANKNNTHTKNIFLGVVVIFTMLLLGSCAKKSVAPGKTEAAPTETPGTTIAVPAETKGQVEIKRDINSNYVIQISLKDLEAVNTVDPSKKAYIVWMNTDKQMVKNLGQISSKTGWLADKSKSFFEAVSEFKPTKIFITEEDIVTATKPGMKIIWSTSRF